MNAKTNPSKKYESVNFQDVANFLRGPFGSSIKKSVCVKKGKDTYKLYEQGNVIRNDFNRGEYYLTKEKFKELEKFEVCSGDILITCAGTLGKIAVVPDNIEKGIFNSVLMRIRLDNKKILTKYFIYYFLSPEVQDRIFQKSVGAAIKNLFATKTLKMFEIPLPPISVQKQIVEILDKAESLKSNRKQSNEETNQLIQNIFHSMFGNPILNERGWIMKKICEVSEVVSGSTPDTTNADYWGGTIKWITPAELIDGDNYYYRDTQRKITELGSKSIGGRLFPKDTVMLTTRAPIGKVAIAGDEMCSNQGFKNLICDKKQLNPIYTYILLLSKKKYLNDLGTGATFKEINKKTVENIEIAIPPLNLQNKFASIVELIESIKGHQSKSTKEVSLLFDALKKKAFAGDLIVE